MKTPKQCPSLDAKITKIIEDSIVDDPDFEYWFNIALTKIKYFVRNYEATRDERWFNALLIYLIEKWERHARFNNEFPELLKHIKESFKEEKH